MLGLKLPTDPRWADVAAKNIEEILTDHAYCEQKAASTAISLLVHYPDYPDLVQSMAALAREEMSHFEMVHEKIMSRGYALGRERKDAYVAAINTFFPKSGDRKLRLVHRLLLAALIEARSCERFKVLSENIQDAELAQFYRGLMVSEAQHYTLFLGLARKHYNREVVDQLWKELLEFEGSIITQFGTKEHIHG